MQRVPATVSRSVEQVVDAAVKAAKDLYPAADHAAQKQAAEMLVKHAGATLRSRKNRALPSLR